MFDQMRNAYSQMQPGDKMVMQLHKSSAPSLPEYQNPSAPPAAPSAPPMMSAPGAPMGAPVGMPPAPMGLPSAPAAGVDPLIAAMRARFPRS